LSCIEAGPSTNTIYGGPTGDAINGSDGLNTIFPGKGTNVIDTVASGTDQGVDKVVCSGSNDTVFADPTDIVQHCAHVFRTHPSKDVRKKNQKHQKHKK
jgi:hypothetical protein